MFSIGFNPGDNTWQDNILKTVAFFEEYSLLQIDRRFFATTQDRYLGEGESETLTFLLNTESGETFYTDKKLPRILAVSDCMMVAVNSDYIISTIYKKP